MTGNTFTTVPLKFWHWLKKLKITFENQMALLVIFTSEPPKVSRLILFARAIKTLTEQCPDIRVHIRSGNADDILETFKIKAFMTWELPLAVTISKNTIT